MEALYGSRAVYVDGGGDMMDIVATFSKKSYHSGGVTHILLVNVIVDGEFWRDHCWVSMTKRWRGVSLYAGVKVKFNAIFKPKFNSKTLLFDKKRLAHIRGVSIVS